ncbi:hypothetical protein BJY52DRAFT_869777 [Lactarius psammicola]|nr:hypothetical protein BJY52DRAFT_869777 [Lactarius psammicola]
MPPPDHNVPTFAISSDLDPSMALELNGAASGSSTPGVTDDDDVLDPTFHSSPAPPPRARSQPEVDAMALLSQNLESTEQFLTHLRRLDTGRGRSAYARGARGGHHQPVEQDRARSRRAGPRAPQMRARVPAYRR